jgi:hypothetical protein
VLPSLPQIPNLEPNEGFVSERIVDKKIQIFFGGSNSPATFGALLQRTPCNGVDLKSFKSKLQRQIPCITFALPFGKRVVRLEGFGELNRT